jgi:hypothetical protein
LLREAGKTETEEKSVMMELNVTLEFACCVCEQSVTVKVQCSGKGLYQDHSPVAAVNVPCPTCGQINQLLFEPNGTVRSVNPYRCFRVLPQPSIN